MTEPLLVLASNSPRRRQLLGLFGLAFRTQPADIDETPLPDEAPAAYVLRLARSKAAAVSALCQPHELVIAADTTVADGNELLGKPQDAADAWRMLRQLSGRTHQVYTGVALQRAADGLALSLAVESPVPMRLYREDEIAAYIAGGDPFDKAGAYAIQHPGFHPVEGFSDCYANVMGAPLCHLGLLLRRAGVSVDLAALPAACQASLNYACPVFTVILGREP